MGKTPIHPISAKARQGHTIRSRRLVPASGLPSSPVRNSPVATLRLRLSGGSLTPYATRCNYALVTSLVSYDERNLPMACLRRGLYSLVYRPRVANELNLLDAAGQLRCSVKM